MPCSYYSSNFFPCKEKSLYIVSVKYTMFFGEIVHIVQNEETNEEEAILRVSLILWSFRKKGETETLCRESLRVIFGTG